MDMDLEKQQNNERAPLLKNLRYRHSDLNYSSDSAMSYYNAPGIETKQLRPKFDTDVDDDDDYGDTEDSMAHGRAINQKDIRSKRTRVRNMSKKMKTKSSTSVKKRVSAYCNFDQIAIFRLMKWLERPDTEPLPGAEGSVSGWQHVMYMGALHSMCHSGKSGSQSAAMEDGGFLREKNVFTFSHGVVVFWGLTRTEEQAHLIALGPFSKGNVKQIQVEDLDYLYGDVLRIANDSITLTSSNPCEKLAISFAMAQSCKLDVFEDRVGETITDTKHIPEMLATTGSINYSQKDISKLIGKLFIVRSDVNLNSEILDEPDFFWEYDEYEPLYAKTMQYLDVSNRVQILNSRLDILRELLEVLSQQLENQHATKLEWIIIWLIVAEVVVQVVWNMLIKDILGFFPGSTGF